MSLKSHPGLPASVEERPAYEYTRYDLQELASPGLQQETADPRISQSNLAQVVAMVIDNDYLHTKHALVAMTKAFKRYIEYSSRYDAYLVGQIDKQDLDKAMEEFAVYPTPDEGALSSWIELVLRETGLELYPDELATMFNVPETQANRIVSGLFQKDLLVRDDDN